MALAVAMHAATTAADLQVSAVTSPQSADSAAAAKSASHFNTMCASSVIFLSLAGGDASSFLYAVNVVKYWAQCASAAAQDDSSRSSFSMVTPGGICSAVTDGDKNAARVVARWLSDAVVEDSRNRRLATVTQSSIWRHVVEWTRVTGCFVCQRALEQLIDIGDWGQLMRAAHECSIHPQVVMSFVSACAVDSVQKT